MERMNLTPDQYKLLLEYIELSAKGLIGDAQPDPEVEEKKKKILSTLGMTKEEALVAAEGAIIH